MVFDVEITDLRGFILATTRSDRAGTGIGGGNPAVFSQYSGLEVEIPLSDSRTAKVTFSLFDPVISHLWFDRTVQTAISGTVAKTNASAVLTGTGTDFLAELDVGDSIIVPGGASETRTILSIASKTSLTVSSNFANTASGQTASVSRSHRVAALGRMLRIYYRGALVFWGPTLLPVARASTAQIEVSAHDPTLRLKHHYVNFSDPDLIGTTASTEATRPALPLDYTTVRKLLQAAQNLAGQNNYPPLGIAEGTNDAAANAATFKLTRGDNVWDRMTEIRESRYGPDIEFEPRTDLGIAGTHDDLSTWPFYGRMNTYAKQGSDRTQTVTFRHDGSALDNLEDWEWAPSGDVVRNQVSLIEQGTDETPGFRVFGHDLKAWEDVGIYAAWENPLGGNSGGATAAALQDFANDFVHAQSRPPQFLTLHPKLESATSPGTPRYLNPYGVGDRVSVVLVKGHLAVTAVVRITKVTLKQADAANNVKTELEVVPRVTNIGNVTTGTD